MTFGGGVEKGGTGLLEVTYTKGTVSTIFGGERSIAPC